MFDPSSFANLNEIRVKHVHLTLTADFNKKILAGHVIHSAEVVVDGVSQLVLDSNFVDIQKVSIILATGQMQQLQVSINYLA